MPASIPASFFLFRAVRHFWPWILVVAALGSAAAVVAGRYTPPVYRSEAILLMQQYPGAPDARQAGGRLKDMLMASERLSKVLEDARLFTHLRTGQERVEEMRKKTVFRAHPGATFSISVLANTPEQAQQATRDLADGLIEDDGRLRGLEAQRNRIFLQGEKKRLQAEVKNREDELQAFLREHPEVALQPEIELVTTDDGTRALEQELERLRQAQDRSSGLGGLDSDSAASAARQRAEMELSRARLELSEKRDLLTEAHPDVILARQRLDRAEDAYKRSMAAESASRKAALTAATSPNAESERLAKQIDTLESKLASARTGGRGNARGRRNKELAPLQVQYQSLRHITEDVRERLSRLEEQQFQAEMLEKMQTGEGIGLLTILDPAYRPAAPEVNRGLRVAMAGIGASVMLGAFVAFLRALISDKVRDRRDVEWLAGASVLAVIPKGGTRG